MKCWCCCPSSQDSVTLHKKFIADCYKRLEVRRVKQKAGINSFLFQRNTWGLYLYLFSFSGRQLGPWGSNSDTCCYQGNQDADSHRHANGGHFCTITFQVQRGVWVRTELLKFQTAFKWRSFSVLRFHWLFLIKRTFSTWLNTFFHLQVHKAGDNRKTAAIGWTLCHHHRGGSFLSRHISAQVFFFVFFYPNTWRHCKHCCKKDAAEDRGSASGE